MEKTLNETIVAEIGELFVEVDRLRIILTGVPMLLPFGTTGITYSGLLRGTVWLKEALRHIDETAEVPTTMIGTVADLPAAARIKEVELSINERLLPRLRVLMNGQSVDRFYSLAISQAYVCFTETCAFLLEEAKKNELSKERFGRPNYLNNRRSVGLYEMIPE